MCYRIGARNWGFFPSFLKNLFIIIITFFFNLQKYEMDRPFKCRHFSLLISKSRFLKRLWDSSRSYFGDVTGNKNVIKETNYFMDLIFFTQL